LIAVQFSLFDAHAPAHRPVLGPIMGRMGGCVGFDARLTIEIRDESVGWLIGWADASHSWDGERAVDGYVTDPWLAAAEAVAMARACLAAPSREAFFRQRLIDAGVLGPLGDAGEGVAA
jgi:hypothetical protein